MRAVGITVAVRVSLAVLWNIDLVRNNYPSGLNLLKRWVQAFQLDARVGSCKAPVGFVVVVIAARAPCSDLADKGGSVGDAAVEALA